MRVKKIFITVLTAVMLLSSITALATENTDTTGAEEVEEKVAEIEASISSVEKETEESVANVEYQDLINTIFIDNEYPSYYAGAYINEDDDLVVVLTEESDTAVSAVKEAIGKDDVTIQYAENSLNSLKSIQNSYANIYEQLYAEKEQLCTEYNVPNRVFSPSEVDLLDDLAGFYIDEERNELVVEIRNITDSKIESFKLLFGEDLAVRFVNGHNFALTASEWRPGRRIYSSDSNYFSTGYRCYYLDANGTRYNGFVTAGHAISSGGSVYRSLKASNKLGECKVSQFSGNSDAAFIYITDSAYEASNTMYYSNTSGGTGGVTLVASNYATNVPQGTTIYKVGSTSYLTSGTVQTNGYTVTISGVTISDTLRTTALNLSGDSGGCAYILMNGDYIAAGTMSASEYIGDELNVNTFLYSYVSQIKNARTDLGIRKY